MFNTKKMCIRFFIFGCIVCIFAVGYPAYLTHQSEMEGIQRAIQKENEGFSFRKIRNTVAGAGIGGLVGAGIVAICGGAGLVMMGGGVALGYGFFSLVGGTVGGLTGSALTSTNYSGGYSYYHYPTLTGLLFIGLLIASISFFWYIKIKMEENVVKVKK